MFSHIDNILYMLYTIFMNAKNTLNATEARNRFFEILNAVIFRGEEYIVRKEDAGSVRIVPEKPEPSPEEVKKILKEVKEVFAKSAKRKYWSVIDTPAWRKKEREYLKNLSKGIIK